MSLTKVAFSKKTHVITYVLLIEGMYSFVGVRKRGCTAAAVALVLMVLMDKCEAFRKHDIFEFATTEWDQRTSNSLERSNMVDCQENFPIVPFGSIAISM